MHYQQLNFSVLFARTAAYLSNGSVYLYSFNYIPLSSPFARLSQPVHGQELPFVFNTANSSALTQIIFPVNTFDANEQVLASAMSLLWIRFVINGNPNTPIGTEGTNPIITQLAQLGGWSKYSGNDSNSSYLIFSNIASGNSSATVQLSTNGYHSPTCAAWDAIVPNPSITKQCAIGYDGPDCLLTSGTVAADGYRNTLNTVSFLMIYFLLFLLYID